MIEIKLCGLKEPTHLKAAYNLGVKYVGFVFANLFLLPMESLGAPIENCEEQRRNAKE